MEIRLRNTAAVFKEIDEQITQIKLTEIKRITTVMLDKLSAATPVDTGFAREAWSVGKLTHKGTVVSNTAPYIEYLNNGSSSQAPRYFIEEIALKYGKAIGAIITVKHLTTP